METLYVKRFTLCGPHCSRVLPARSSRSVRTWVFFSLSEFPLLPMSLATELQHACLMWDQVVLRGWAFQNLPVILLETEDYHA